MNCLKIPSQSQTAEKQPMSKYLGRPAHAISTKIRKSGFQEDHATVRVVAKEHCREKIPTQRAGQLSHLAEDNFKNETETSSQLIRAASLREVLQKTKTCSNFGTTPFTLGLRDVS